VPAGSGDLGRFRRVSSPDLVARFIRYEILNGSLRSGERLRQDEIADQLGISRIPIREAIIGLDREGWLRIEPNRGGVFVTGFRSGDVTDHYELRGIVLGLIAKRATESADSDDVKALMAKLKQLRAASDSDAFSGLNEELLAQIIRLSDSSRLRAALKVSPSVIPEDFFTIVAGSREIQESGIASVVRATKAGDPAAAGLAMRKLLRRQGLAVVDAFQRRGLFELDRDAGTNVANSGSVAGRSAAAMRVAESGADAVARQIRTMVIDGRLAPGQRLPQDDIAAIVGVSRIPVREAIIALEREGWLRVEPLRGAFVNPLDDGAVVDHYDLYGCYFGFAARRAIERSGHELCKLDAASEKVATLKSATAFERANRTFLDTLVGLARSPRLVVALRVMVPLVEGNFFAAVPGSMDVQRAGIAALHAAIRKRASLSAERICASMEAEQGANVASILGQARRRTAGN
jgi:DNA-binding GntR family transcriptional regulator